MAKGKKKVQKTAAAIPDELALQDPITCSNDACTNATYNPLRLRACSRCKCVQYCSIDCQTADWRGRHKRLCARLAAAYPLEPETEETRKARAERAAKGPQPGDIVIPVDTSVLDDIVDEFNALPRTYKAPSGMVDNHWMFDVRHIALHPATDVLMLFHPASGYVHIETLPKNSRKNDRVNPVIVAVALLKSFNKGLEDAAPMAPWAWSAPSRNPAFAKDVSHSLGIIGARDELCKVSTSRAVDVQKMDAKWDELYKTLRDHSVPQQQAPPSPTTGAGAQAAAHSATALGQGAMWTHPADTAIRAAAATASATAGGG